MYSFPEKYRLCVCSIRFYHFVRIAVPRTISVRHVRRVPLPEICFGRIGKIDVYHQSYIGLVNTHTECVGCYHDSELSVYPPLLTLVFGIIVQSGMIERCSNTLFIQKLRYFFCLFTVARIYNSRTLYASQDVKKFFSLVFCAADDIG